MLGVYSLLAFTLLGHECQDLLSLCNEMHVECRLDLGLYFHLNKVNDEVSECDFASVFVILSHACCMVHHGVCVAGCCLSKLCVCYVLYNFVLDLITRLRAALPFCLSEAV